MNPQQTSASKDTAPWTPEHLEAFGREIYDLGAKAKSQMGPQDLQYLKKINKLSKTSQILGRSLIHFSFDPVTWSAGVLALWIHLQLDGVEIGHSALHGCWDELAGAEKFKSTAFKWNCPVDETSWRHEHNSLHHQFTNIAGRDPDLNYGGLRIAEQTPWLPGHLFQIGQFFWTAPIFFWVIAAHATGLTDFTHPKDNPYYASVLPDRKLKTFFKSLKQTAKKMLPYSLRQFAFWPLLAGPFAWKVFAGNFTAEIIRNIYTAATIYAGHFGDDLKYNDPDFRAHGRGEWFKSQVEGAHNYKVPEFISLMCGALDYQIEHHLYPKLPPNRLRELAPKVRAICKKYGVAYNRASWGESLGKSLKRIAKMSLPLNKPVLA
jgi:NADPH-dependent stearoyl-CoA 9-desaturase